MVVGKADLRRRPTDVHKYDVKWVTLLTHLSWMSKQAQVFVNAFQLFWNYFYSLLCCPVWLNNYFVQV